MEAILHQQAQLEPICFERASAPAPMMVDGDWTKGLPVLRSDRIVLRELEKTDAPSLLSLLSAEEVSKFISPPPTTAEGFQKFIQWAQRERIAVSTFVSHVQPGVHVIILVLLEPERHVRVDGAAHPICRDDHALH